MKKVCVIGGLGNGKNMLNGQTVKTKILIRELSREYGDSEVFQVNTSGSINLMKLVPRMIMSMIICKNIIILPAQNGMKIIPPILYFFNKIFQRDLHYDVIGGWLPSYLDANRYLVPYLKTFKGIYVETATMCRSLESKGFTNVSIVPNCKDLAIINESNLIYCDTKPYRLVTFSRVMEQKGIGDAIKAVEDINNEFCEIVFTLDIYGQIDENETEWFDDLMANATSAIRYKGYAAFDRSVEILREYFALLFPTKFYTEGIPGTILDAYAAGLPVISSKWESFADLVDEGITGLGYEFGKIDALRDVLKAVANNPCLIFDKKRNCIAKAYNYLPEKVIPRIDFSDGPGGGG